MSHIQPAALPSVYVILIATMLATGCGSQPSRPQYYWENSSLAGLPQNQYDARFRGHSAQCQAYATGLANSAYPQQQGPTTYQTEYSGSVGGKYYSGTAETTPTQQGGMGQGPLSGYLRAQRENERQSTIQNAFEGCMAQNGWYEVAANPKPSPRPQGQTGTSVDWSKKNLGVGEACQMHAQCGQFLSCSDYSHVCTQ